MVKEEAKKQKLRKLFKQYLRRKLGLFDLFSDYRDLLGPKMKIDIMKIGEDKIKITVSDGKDIYSVLTNYVPKRGDEARIKDFGALSYGELPGRTILAIDDVYTTKHARTDELKTKAEELAAKYEKLKRAK